MKIEERICETFALMPLLNKPIKKRSTLVAECGRGIAVNRECVRDLGARRLHIRGLRESPYLERRFCTSAAEVHKRVAFLVAHKPAH